MHSYRLQVCWLRHLIQFQRWNIGDEIGSSLANAWCIDNADCPHELGPYWEYFDSESGRWVQDPDVTVKCT